MATTTRKTDAIQLDADELTRIYAIIEDEVRQADADRNGFNERVEDSRKLLDSRPTLDADEPEWHTTVSLPIVRIFRDAMHSRAMRGLFAPTPFYQGEVMTGNPDIGPFAERFFDHQLLTQVNFEAVCEPAVQSAFDDGTGITLVRWETRKGIKPTWVRKDTMDTIIDEATLQSHQILIPGEPEVQYDDNALLYDGPRVDRVDVLNVGTIPAAHADIQTSPGAFYVTKQSGATIEDKGRRGVYSMDAVNKMKAWDDESGERGNSDEAALGITQQNSNNPRWNSKRFNIHDLYYRYQGPGDTTEREWLFTFHMPSSTILRAKPYISWSGQRPLFDWRPFSAKCGLYGYSISDNVGEFERCLKYLLRATINGMRLGIEPEILVDAGVKDTIMAKIQRMRKPRGVVPIPNLESVIDKIKPFVIGFHPNEAMPLIQMMWQFAQTAGSVSATELGTQAKAGTTAHEIERMLQEGQEINMMIAQRMARTMDMMAREIWALNVAHHGSPEIERLWNEVNARGGGGGDLFTVFVNTSYRWTASGTKETANAAIRQGRAKEMFGVLYPLAEKPEHRFALKSDLITEGFGKRNPERYIGTEAEAIELAEMQMQAQAMMSIPAVMGGDPAGGGGISGNVAGGDPTSTTQALVGEGMGGSA